MRTAILLHNLHPLARGWDNDMWGNASEHRLGRIPKALSLLCQFKAELFIMGGAGVTHAETNQNLAEHLAQYIERRWDELALFREFAGWHLSNLNERLAAARDLTLAASTTFEEVEGALALCAARGINQLILVSSPSHTPRCLRDADGLRLRNPAWRDINVLAASSDVYYQDASAEKTVIVEFPHREDTPQEFHALHAFTEHIMQRFMNETPAGKQRIVSVCNDARKRLSLSNS